MNRLSKKFIVGISLILLLTMTVSLFINSNLIERYYVHTKRVDMNTICDRLEEQLLLYGNTAQAVSSVEQTEEVTIAWAANQGNLDVINNDLRGALRVKGIGFQKFWLWDEAYQSVMDNGRKLCMYNQPKLNYSILVEYMEFEQTVYAVAMIIPHISDAIRIVNGVTCLVMAGALLVMILLVIMLVKRITRPLDQLKQFADDIAAQKFGHIEIHTRDELEVVASSMNQMCSEIQAYQKELLDKNQQMEQLLDNVAHDLKTPIALVKAYAGGIKDGLDDGTFLDTVICQNDRIGAMVESLLFLSRIKKQEISIEEIALDTVLGQLLTEQSILAKREDMVIRTSIVPQAVIQSSREISTLILSNLLSNALKYGSGTVIEVSLQKAEKGYVFEITNQTTVVPDLSRIWEPFYVGEESRNKDLSGTGLGLALTKGAAEKLGYPLSCYINDDKITFQVQFCQTPVTSL